MSIDQQKVQLLPCPFCGRDGEHHESRSGQVSYYTTGCSNDDCIAYWGDQMQRSSASESISKWNTRQAAIAHASSATGKENLTVGEGEAVAWLHVMHMEGDQTSKRPSMSKKNPFGKPGRDYSRSYKVTSEPLYTHPAPSAEDARDAARWRKFVSMVDPDRVPGGFNVYLAMSDDVDAWCYCEDDITELVDQALAAERGEGNGCC